MVIPNSKCMPKTIEYIMTKQTDNIFTLKECRIFLLYILNRKINKACILAKLLTQMFPSYPLLLAISIKLFLNL